MFQTNIPQTMKRIFTSSLRILCFGILLSIGCTQEELTPNWEERFPDGFPIRLSTTDYNSQNTYYLLNDAEPSTVFFDANQRSFRVDQPLQITLDDDLWFQLRFYSPRALPEVTVWAKMEGYDEEFKLFVFEKIMPFQQFRMQLPFAMEDMTAITRSGKLIRIMANPHLPKENLTLTIECDAPYYQTLKSIKSHWRIWYSDYGLSGNWQWPLRVYHAREAVALALNMSYMYSTDEFARALQEFGPLHSDNNKTLIDKNVLLRKAINHSGLRFGHCTTVYGLGGGETFGLHEEIFYEHYPDDKSITETIFHEFAHCIGYGHNGNMTYEQTGPGWITLCHKVYTDLALAKKLPVYSRRFLHTRHAPNKYNNTYYYPSKHIIEDPELDEIDGGLERGNDFLNTDWGEDENLPALSFRLDYNDAETNAKDYMPRGVYVYGDKMYVTNDIRSANFSWDVYDLSTGKPVHERRFDQWTNPDGNTQTIGTPVDILRSHDKIYLAGSNNCLFVFDAENYECINKLSLGFDAVGLAATKGLVYAYRGNARAFPEHDFSHGHIATSNNIESHSLNSMTADYEGNVYAVAYYLKKLIRLDTKYLMATRITASKEWTFDANPLGAAWSRDGRLFVSFAQTEQAGPRFCEVDPETGAVIKDYTTIGDITLNNPAKCVIRRNTLFIVDRINGLCVYAIPMNQLN